MNKMNISFKPVAFFIGLAAITATSCQDWLTMYPQDRVVEEEFWEDKNDLEGVRYAAYKQMCSTVNKFIVWGDLRSDSYILANRTGRQSDYDTYDEIMKGMPDSSMSIFDWGGVYTTINYCNKVLQHGPEVLEKDKQFTTVEWNRMRAEMVTLRAMNYFYLLRAFKDIPYSTEVINSDGDVKSFGLSNQLSILDSLIVDCERVKGQARNRFTTTNDTKGMITNSAIYALLSDMYLWRASLYHGRFGADYASQVTVGDQVIDHTVAGDYEKCIEYADLSLASLQLQTDENNSDYGTQILEKVNWGMSNCNMIKNDFSGAYNGVVPLMEAQCSIFKTDEGRDGGNSDESIFELQSRMNEWGNDAVTNFYGYRDETLLTVSPQAIGQCYGSQNIGSDATRFDSRIWISAQNRILTEDSPSGSEAQSNYYCLKYSQPRVGFYSSGGKKEITVRSINYDYNNWVVYRMTDVMLMKAEALACLRRTSECQNIVNAIHRRSYCDFDNNNAVDYQNISSTNRTGNAVAGVATEDLPSNGYDVYLRQVMNERQIELLGEGKRWFDLVRWAERYSYQGIGTDPLDERESTEEQPVYNGYTGVALVAKTFLRNTYSDLYTTLRNRMKNRYGLYCPIYYMEVKSSNGAIEQNPVWNKSKYDN